MKNITMKTMKKLFLPCVMFAMLSCENPVEQPFRAGLGPVEDIRPPTVTLETPVAGKYIYGIPLFQGSAEDDYSLDRVEFRVASHSGLREGAADKWNTYQRVPLKLSKQNMGSWSNAEFDTTVYKDGPINIQIRVWDSYNKSAQTDEIAFYVKNEPTAINLTAPYITRGEENGEVGGDLLNYGRKDTQNGISYIRKMPKGDPLTGSISHDEGIYTGPESGSRYPPQIRLWRVNDMITDPMDTEGYAPGELPPLDEVPWHTLNNKELMVVGIGNYIFSYDFSQFPENKTACFYGFEIRAQNEDGRSAFHYPRDFYPDNTDWNNENNKFNSYVLFYYSPDNETPIVEIYGLEDIKDYWNKQGGSYNTIKDSNNVDLDDDRPHPYVNNLTVDKNGEFILRVKASHSEGIAAAEVYWENKNSDLRGRFIWDFEAEDQDPANLLWDLDVRNPYNMWGYREPYAPYIKEGVRTHRSFFFHYRHDGDYRVPSDLNGVSVWGGGRPQVQLYTGGLSSWQAGKESGSLVADNTVWEDVGKDSTKLKNGVLEDGSYKIEVYAHTPARGASKKLLEINVRLDTAAPEVKVNQVEGVYPSKSTPYADVNGVIKPTLSFKDNNGSGLRVATKGDYFRNGSVRDYEQFYILINDETAIRNALDNQIKLPNWWPINEAAGVLNVIPGVTVIQDKAIFNSTFKLKTSGIYSPVEPDALPDGKYLLYFFCRDNAFNVGYDKIALDVRKEADKPVLNWERSSVKQVTNPNVSHDNPPNASSDGFVYNGQVRNKLGVNTSLKLYISDDDSLDLGTAVTDGNALSSIKISFVGSQQDANDVITVLSDPQYTVFIEDSEIKKIFTPQPVVSGGGREAVNWREGEIRQDVLVKALNDNGQYGTVSGASLPDGIYKFTVEFADYAKEDPIKMKGENDTNPPDVAKTTESFWIVVDSKGPEYTIAADSVKADTFVKTAHIKGTVRDKNGPVKLEEPRVIGGPAADRDKITFNKDKFDRDTAITDTWEAEFDVLVNMTQASGRFQIEISFTDRFGNPSSYTLWLQVDRQPPTAAIGTKIPTFARDYEDAGTGLTSASLGATPAARSLNRQRLANGVLHFSINARDTIDGTVPGKLEEVKWWLVPDGTPAPTGATYSTYASAKMGILDSDFSKTQYIDTSALSDGLYRLYVMAKDVAQNVSLIDTTNSIQPIYLLQEHDKPYFGYWDGTGDPPITPANGMVRGDALLRGEITDDDGFLNADNTTIRAGSVRIWMSANSGAGSVDVDLDSSLSANNFGAPITYNPAGGPNTFTTGLSLSRKGVISMNNIDLKNFFGSGSGALSTDGLKFYIIEATDSHVGKFHDDGGTPGYDGTSGKTPADRVMRRKLFSFIYDTQPPGISLSYPDPADKLKTFGPNANDNSAPTVNFHLEGTISDANLEMTEDGYYFFDYRLDSSGDKKRFKLIHDGTNIIVSPSTPNTPASTVTFTISAARFCTELAFMTGAVSSDVNHTITLYVYDKSGKDNTCSFNFIKDMTAPTVTFANLDKKIRLPRLTTTPQDWWASTDYTAKRTWLEQTTNNVKVNELPVVTYDKSNPDSKPQLKVTFDDITSFINTGTLKFYIDGDTVARTTPYTVTPSASNTVRSVSCTIDLVNAANPNNLLDGVHSIRFEIQDSAGNTLWSDDRTTDAGSGNNIYWGFRINSGPPVIEGTMPGTPAGSRNVFGNRTATPFFSITNVVAKGPNLKDAQLTIKYLGTPPASWGSANNMTSPTWTFEGTGTNNEVLTWTTYNITTAMLSGTAEGDYQLELLARGRDDVSSVPGKLVSGVGDVWPFTIDKSSPGITIDDFHSDTQSTGARAPNYWVANNLTANRKVLTSASARIQGRVTDTYSNLTAVQYLIQRYSYTNGSWTTGASYYNNAAGGSWQPGEVWNDLLGSTETTRQKEVSLTPGSLTDIADGFYRVRLRARDSAYVNGTSSATWPATGGSTTSDGNPIVSSYYYFFYAPTNTQPSITHDEPVTLFSAKAAAASNTAATAALTFVGTADSLNGYASMTVQIAKGGAAFGSPITITGFPITSGDWNRPYSWTTASNLNTFPTADTATANGVYTLTFTVTDWAGRQNSKSRTITLDNKLPTGAFTAPSLMSEAVRNTSVSGVKIYEFASETFYGGEDASIEGTAEDTNEVVEIWYHLGYPVEATNTNNMAFPTEGQIIASVLGTGVTTDRGGAANNARFDEAATKGQPNSKAGWFKYDLSNSATYPRPDLNGTQLFDNYSAPLYNWKLNIPESGGNSLSSYAGTGIQVKGTTYAPPNGVGRRMTQKINESGLPTTEQKNGLYSLPLWVRVADKAGNVKYFQQDIWLYPNGDYPSNIVTNPTLLPASSTDSRGGTVSFDGTASDNKNVKKVIYRVRADDVPYNASGWNVAPTGTNPVTTGPKANQIIEPVGGSRFDSASGDAEWNLFNSADRDPSITTNGWYKATLESESLDLKAKPWSFFVNANNEFITEKNGVNPIRDWGFKASGSSNNNMIRVYVEVLVFDGTGIGNKDNNKMSLGDVVKNPNPGNLGRPDVVVFYLSATSPEIQYTKISDVGTFNTPATTPFAAAATYAGYEAGKTRSGRFAVRATLYGGSGKYVSQVQVRLPSEAGQLGNNSLAQWRTAWDTAGAKNLSGITFFTPTGGFDPITTPNGGDPNPAGSTSSPTGSTQRGFGITFGFNTAASAATGFQQVMQGNWATSGGKYQIEVLLRDNSNPPSETTYRFEIGIDNFAPVADDVKEFSNTKVAGSNQQFFGRAYDYLGGRDSNPSPGYYGVDRVYAWFTKNQDGMNSNVSMTNKNSTQNLTAANSTTTRGIPAFQNRKANFSWGTGDESTTVTNIALTASPNRPDADAGNPGTHYYPAPTVINGVEESTQWVKVINGKQAAQLANNMIWQPITPGPSESAIRWSFMTDTTKLPDGPIYLNYIVVDSAGNASIYQQSMVVMNNYPEITGITLYTDNTGQGAVFTTHEGNEASSYFQVPASAPADGYLNSGFIAKNKYIGFRVETIEGTGNGTMHYRVQYVDRETKNLDNATLREIAEDVAKSPGSRTYSTIYTIANKGSMDDVIWAKLSGGRAKSYRVGTHFAFQATTDDIGIGATGMNYPGTSVYCYKVHTDLIKEKSKSGTTTVLPDEILPNRSFVDDKEFFDANGIPSPTSERGFRFITTNKYPVGIGIDDFASIPEKMGSRPDDPTLNKPDALNNTGTAFFLIKVYDSVNTNANWDYGNGSRSVTEDDQLYDALVVGMNVYKSDSNAPTARLYDLNPYTEIAVTGNNIGTSNQNSTISKAADPIAVGSNIVRGGLFNTNTMRELVKSGYIEPRKGSYALTPRNSDGVAVPDSDYPLKVSGDQATGGDTRDKVSGRIILRGIAWDDQLIDEIRIKIGTTENTILQLNTTTGKMEAVHPDRTDIIPRPTTDYRNLAFAAETLHWKTGHTVEWAYVWDTQTEPAGRPGGGPSDNVPVQVTVKDKNSSGLTSAPETGDNNTTIFHNQINVDIVPYITGFERKTPEFTTKRSLQGWYSFYQGEDNIALLGYNFGQTASDVDVLLNSDGITDKSITTMTGGSVGYDGTPGNTKNRFYFTMPTDAQSGRLNVTVNSVAAYNHTSITTNPGHTPANPSTRSWNRESNSYTPGSNLWINRPHAHIWRSSAVVGNPNTSPRTYMGTSGGSSSNLNHPGMALEYTGTNPGRLHGVWAVYGNANVYYGTNNNSSNAINSGNPPGEPFGTPDISIYNGGGATTANMGYSQQNDGRPILIVKAVVTSTTDGNTIQSNNSTGSTQRWQNIRISKALANTSNAETNVGRIYMTAFDAENKSLWYGIRNGTTNNQVFIDGGNATANVGGETAVSNAGQYSAVDYDSTGPIIAYYDQTSDTVRIAFGTAVAPTAANQFTRRYLLPDTTTTLKGRELRRGSGKYISIKVDKNEGIHLAFYNSVYNTVVYYYAKDRSYINVSNPPAHNGSTIKIHTVDNVVTGGTWTDISVDDNGNPWIVYGDSSRTGNYDGVRVAYKSSNSATSFEFTGALTSPVETGGADITGWEAVSMPSDRTVNNDRLNIEVWPPTNRAGGSLPAGPNWNAAIGYASDMYRVGYFYYPNWKGY